MSRTSNPWTTLSTRTAYESGWLAVEDRRVRDASGQERPYGVVRFKKGGIRMLPIDNAGFTYLVGQYRYAADYYSWELPAGGTEPGEDLIESARRELSEEVGLTAEHWFQVLDMVPSGSMTDERQIGFVAWGFEQTERDPDPQEVLSVQRVPFRAALERVLNGEIRDAGTIALLAAVEIRALQRNLPEELVRRILG